MAQNRFSPPGPPRSTPIFNLGHPVRFAFYLNCEIRIENIFDNFAFNVSFYLDTLFRFGYVSMIEYFVL